MPAQTKTRLALSYICEAFMKNLLALLFSALFFLPSAKGQSSVNDTNCIATIKDDSLLKVQKKPVLRFGPRQEGVCYVLNGVAYNDSLSAIKSLNKVEPWLSINDCRRKKYTEKDFQYIPFQHFLETLPVLQR